ncbi:MAG: pyrroline-5-carboxylate reductase [Dehalococcoidia bacterium]|jgi:pyrroline-5-carboxylate reductase|nr:pyrroline-5-carboxylate reductase [Dehalococcoidia bacterium]
MPNNLSIAFIGGGTMAEAILLGILDKGLAAPGAIAVGEPVSQRRDYLGDRYGVRTTQDNLQAIKGVQTVILAVKPQQLEEVLVGLKGKLAPCQTLLSIVAGAAVDTLSNGLDHLAVIRVMPNTPAQVGQGMSVWTAASDVSNDQKEMTQEILNTLGQEIYVSEEKYLDMATALSASGPAYVFLFLEALIDAGVYLGLTRDVAQTLALQTIQGSVALARESGKHPADLRNMVTSPGGTTAEALLSLEEEGFKGIVINAVVAAHEKAITLGEAD